MAIEKPTWTYKSKGDKQTASEMNELAQAVITNAIELSNTKDDIANLSDDITDFDNRITSIEESETVKKEERNQPNGYAGLDSSGKIPIERIYGATATVTDVAAYELLPATGSNGVIYNVLNTGSQYKWSGSAYIDITDGADNAKKNETSIFDCSNGTSKKYYSSLSDAINAVPVTYRTSNRIISYLSTENATTSAVNYQYHGINSTTWTDLTKWERIPSQTDLADIRSDLNEIEINSNQNIQKSKQEAILSSNNYTDNKSIEILPESVTPSKLSPETLALLNSGGAVTNLADGEDLANIDNVIKFKDKIYEPSNYSGLAKKYLRKNIVEGINILEQLMINDANTIYIIQYDYDLNAQTITVPSNCILKFEGGSLKNGTVIGNKTKIEVFGIYRIFNSITLNGSWVGYITDMYWEYDILLKNHHSIFSSVLLFEVVDIYRKEYWIESWAEITTNENYSIIDCHNSTIYITSNKGSKTTISGYQVYTVQHWINIPSTCQYFNIKNVTILDNGNKLIAGWGEILIDYTRYTYFTGHAKNMYFDNINIDGGGECFQSWNPSFEIDIISFYNCNFRTYLWGIELCAIDLNISDDVYSKFKYIKISNSTFYAYLGYQTGAGITHLSIVETPNGKSHINKVDIDNCKFESNELEGNFENNSCIEGMFISNSTFLNTFLYPSGQTYSNNSKIDVKYCNFTFEEINNSVFKAQYTAEAKTIYFTNCIFDIKSANKAIVFPRRTDVTNCNLLVCQNNIFNLPDKKEKIVRYFFYISPPKGCIVIMQNNKIWHGMIASNEGVYNQYKDTISLPKVYDKIDNIYDFIENTTYGIEDGYIPKLFPISNITGISVADDGYSIIGNPVEIIQSDPLTYQTATFHYQAKYIGTAPWNDTNVCLNIKLGLGSVRLYAIGSYKKIKYYDDLSNSTDLLWVGGSSPDFSNLKNTLLNQSNIWDYEDVEITLTKYYSNDTLRIIIRSRGQLIAWKDISYTETLSIPSYTITPNEYIKYRAFGFSVGGIIGV